MSTAELGRVRVHQTKKRRRSDNSMEAENTVLVPSQGKAKPDSKQIKISTFGPAGENRHKFKRRNNPQTKVLNDEPLEVIHTNL